VAATGWPFADDAGPLMQAFYSHYRAGGSGLNSASAAEALQAGQIDMLRAGGWRAKPVYWAAFFLTGRD
jgi:CHAT domain-containing protein